MRKAILVLAFLALSVNTMAQSRCWGEDGRPIECPTLIEIDLGIDPNGPDCKTCPTNLDFRKDWLYKDYFFKNFLHLPFAMVANTVNVLNAKQIEKVK